MDCFRNVLFCCFILGGDLGCLQNKFYNHVHHRGRPWAGTDPIKIIFSVILHYAEFERSDWLKNLPRAANQNAQKIAWR